MLSHYGSTTVRAFMKRPRRAFFCVLVDYSTKNKEEKKKTVFLAEVVVFLYIYTYQVYSSGRKHASLKKA